MYFEFKPKSIINGFYRYFIIKIDGFVKSQIRRICHFDYREKSYFFSMLRFKDFSSRLVGMTG